MSVGGLKVVSVSCVNVNKLVLVNINIDLISNNT